MLLAVGQTDNLRFVATCNVGDALRAVNFESFFLENQFELCSFHAIPCNAPFVRCPNDGLDGHNGKSTIKSTLFKDSF
jgi:hypothetical protein